MVIAAARAIPFLVEMFQIIVEYLVGLLVTPFVLVHVQKDRYNSHGIVLNGTVIRITSDNDIWIT